MKGRLKVGVACVAQPRTQKPFKRLPENLLQGFQAAFFIAKPVFLKIRTAQRAGFGLAVLPGDAIKGDAHYLVAVFFVAGKAVDGELQGV